jgi:hypothetical protein
LVTAHRPKTPVFVDGHDVVDATGEIYDVFEELLGGFRGGEDRGLEVLQAAPEEETAGLGECAVVVVAFLEFADFLGEAGDEFDILLTIRFGAPFINIATFIIGQ